MADEPKDRRKWLKSHHKMVKWGAVFGVAAAIICHFIPKDYRAICDAVAALCGG